MKTMYLFFRTLLAWSLISLLFFGAALVILLVSPFQTAPQFFPFLRGCCRLAVRIVGMKVTIRQADRIDPHQAYVYMGNHVNLFDHFVLTSAVPHHLIGLGATWQFKIPIYGYLLKRVGVMPLRRTNLEEAIKSIAEAADIIKKNNTSVGIMPEGTRSPTGEMGPFKKGGFHLAINAQVPIMPFSLKGAYAFKRKGHFLFHPGPVEITFGEPIATQGYTKENLPELMDAVRAQIAAPLMASDSA